jgi:hypothetical protein
VALRGAVPLAEGMATVAALVHAAPLPLQLRQRDRDRLRRYDEYLGYHEGTRGAPPRTRGGRVLNFNYARTLVEKGAAYLMTVHRPLVAPLEGHSIERGVIARAERILAESWEANDLERLDLETEIDTAVLGDGAFKVTWDEGTRRAVVSAPDVQGLFAWWSPDDVRRVWRVASRYELDPEAFAQRYGQDPPRTAGQSSGAHGGPVSILEVWTAERFELWAGTHRLEERANPYGVIPFVIYPNLPRPPQFWGLSDIEPLRESLEELNRALSQLSRILELSGNPIAVLENVEEARDIAVQPGAVWEVPDRARAYLLDLLQGGGVRLHVDYVDLVYRTLHDLAETPRIAFGDGGGDRSGVALQTELDPLLRRVARKRLIRTAAFRERDRLILRIAGHHLGERFEGLRHDIGWGPIFDRETGGMLPVP